jgi:hypothetical protein
VFERFTDRARRVLVLAQEEARLLNHSFIGTEHILLGLIHEGEGVAAKALEQLGISLEAVREKVEETIGLSGTAPTGSPPFTPRAKKVLELSLREALQLGHNYIGTEHMLLGLVREGEGVAAQILQDMGADLGDVRQSVIDLVPAAGGEAPPSDWPRHFVRSVPGSDVARTVMGAALRVLSVEIYDTAIAVSFLWTVPERRRGDLPSRSAFMTPSLVDDAGTTYEHIGGSGSRSTWEYYGRRFFTPAPPAEARRLIAQWSGDDGIVIALDP